MFVQLLLTTEFPQGKHLLWEMFQKAPLYLPFFFFFFLSLLLIRFIFQVLKFPVSWLEDLVAPRQSLRNALVKGPALDCSVE